MEVELKKPSQLLVQVPGYRGDKLQSLPFYTSLSGIQFLIGNTSDIRRYFLECIFDIQTASKYWASSEYPHFQPQEIPLWLHNATLDKVTKYIKTSKNNYFILMDPIGFNLNEWKDLHTWLLNHQKWLWISLETIPQGPIHSYRVSYCRKYNDGQEKTEIWGPFQQGSFLHKILYDPDKQTNHV